MSNKETLQSYNNILIDNNNNLDKIRDIVNNLPEAGSGEDVSDELSNYDEKLTEQETTLEDIVNTLKGKGSGAVLKLQDKTIEITENGTTNITADEGYNGLSNVEVVTNVSSGGDVVVGDYVQDGLIAWFDGEDNIEYDNTYGNVLRSRITSTDCIQASSRTFGTATTNPVPKSKKSIINNKTFGYRIPQDFYKQGYTIEAVGRIASAANSSSNSGGWLITMNETATWGIGVLNGNDEIGMIAFVNNNFTADKTVSNCYNKTFGASLFLESVSAKGVTDSANYCKASINGCNWFSVAETTATSSKAYKGHSILCYYVTDDGTATYMADGELFCIRIYNRKLTNEELAHNHAIDKVRFDTFE